MGGSLESVPRLVCRRPTTARPRTSGSELFVSRDHRTWIRGSMDIPRRRPWLRAGRNLFACARPRAQAALGGGFVRPLSRARLAAAVGILGGTIAVAAILHGLQGSPPVCPHGF